MCSGCRNCGALMLPSLFVIAKSILERKSTVQTLMLTTAEWEQVEAALSETPRVIPELVLAIRKYAR